jgi:hypothetical protein
LTVDTIVSSSTIFSSGSNTLGDAAGDTQTLFGTVDIKTGPLNVSGTIIATGPIKGTGSINLQPDVNDARFLEIYNTSPTDTHITASGGQLFLGDDETYVKVDNYGSVNRIDIVAGNLINVSSSVQFTGSVQITGSLDVNGNSVVLSSQTGSFVTSAITGSSLITASVSLNTITFTKGDGSTFPITVNTGSGGGGTGSAFPFTGSAQISGSLTISNDTDGVVFDIKQPNHSTESIYSIRMGNQADVTESIAVGGNLLLSGSFNNTYRIVIPTTINDLTGSLLGTASYATVAGNGMNLGANTFTGSQTIQSQSLLLQASSSIALNTSFFTASTAGTTDGANVYMFAGSANSGSTTISGSRNIGTVSQLANTLVATRRGGFNGSGNFGAFAHNFSTASVAPILNNNFLASGIAHLMNNTSSVTTATSNIIQGAVTITGSATSAIQLTQNNLDTVTIENNFTSSIGANQSVNVNGSIIKGSGGAAAGNILVKFASTGSNANARQFINNILYGAGITASMEVSGNNNLANLYNTAVIGAGLVVSGTMPSQAIYLSGSMFVGKWNSTASIYPMVSSSLADAGQVVFAVGAGIASGSRKTPLYVSASGLTVIGDNAFISGTLTIEQNTDTNAIVLTQQGVSATPTWALSQTAGGDTTTTIITNATHYFTGLGSTRYHFSIPTVVSSSLTVTGSTNSLGNVSITGSVAISGSLRVNGNLQYNYGEFWMSSSQTPSAGVSQSVVFDSTGHSVGVAISGSGDLIKITNGGTYNIQFSAQINASAGTDTMWMWFKKNGVNIAASNSKAVLANNTAQLITVNIIDTATANDYYEIAYQNNAGNAQILSDAATGNLPSIPGVILTVTQVA